MGVCGFGGGVGAGLEGVLEGIGGGVTERLGVGVSSKSISIFLGMKGILGGNAGVSVFLPCTAVSGSSTKGIAEELFGIEG